MPEDKFSDICSVSIYSHLADLRGEHGCCQAKNKILPPDISEKVNTLLPVVTCSILSPLSELLWLQDKAVCLQV